jgi:hypothetical protein
VKKYIIIGFSCLIIEIASTFYIRSVSQFNVAGMLFLAFIGPFLGLPFISYIIEAESRLQRFKIALASAIGYMLGAIIVIYLIA